MTTYQEVFTKCTGALRVAVDALEERIEEIARLRAQRDRLRYVIRSIDADYLVSLGGMNRADYCIEQDESYHLQSGDMTDEP